MSKPGKSDQAPEAAPDNAGYEVGYGKPPKHSQFKKGNSAGKGRPRGSKNLGTIVNEAMQQKLTATLGGKKRKLSKIELTVHQVAIRASQGDPKAADKALRLYERYGPQENPEGPEPEKIRRDLEALRHYVAMMDQIFPPGDEGAQ